MNHIQLRKQLLIAAAGGLAGFCILILAWFIFFVIALSAADFLFGGGSPSAGESLIMSGLVPIIIALSAATPAWILRAKFWLGLLAGIMGMSFFILFDEILRPPLVSYGAFDLYETRAAISAIAVTMFVITIGNNRFRLGGSVVLVILTWILILVRSILPLFDPSREQIIGLATSLFAWTVVPLVTTLIINTRLENK